MPALAEQAAVAHTCSVSKLLPSRLAQLLGEKVATARRAGGSYLLAKQAITSAGTSRDRSDKSVRPVGSRFGRACPTTGRTRLFKHRSNCRVRPVNAGSAGTGFRNSSRYLHPPIPYCQPNTPFQPQKSRQRIIFQHHPPTQGFLSGPLSSEGDGSHEIPSEFPRLAFCRSPSQTVLR
ncbi:hypothetical protein PCASD_12819 [Puccinia coronata f. sp. avenae]|uniref:Uncharacterized protein n=1 Tax=Puccinia coronata f. sp. avenae TaxID=200324 RepID=A0A2N5UVX5_9BASI|nr:hypothetical protein PCASD_12819 [Puccinia coronata f. sp. avenae]